MTIRRIADIPFVERELLELLALSHDRRTPDLDYAGFGWARAPRVVLDMPGAPPREVIAPIVIALHSADLQATEGDVDLLFETDAQSLVVPLSAFWPHALAAVPTGPDIVLALCNPTGVVPQTLGRVVHVAHGDVVSWLDPVGTEGWSVRLSAPTWRTLGGAHGPR